MAFFSWRVSMESRWPVCGGGALQQRPVRPSLVREAPVLAWSRFRNVSGIASPDRSHASALRERAAGREQGMRCCEWLPRPELATGAPERCLVGCPDSDTSRRNRFRHVRQPARIRSAPYRALEAHEKRTSRHRAPPGGSLRTASGGSVRAPPVTGRRLERRSVGSGGAVDDRSGCAAATYALARAERGHFRRGR